jgi:Cu(I)/Ag(I) efflux system membrane fusion protein
MKTRFLLLPAVVAAALVGWFAHKIALSRQAHSADSPANARRVLFYQSAMHPWIKSDKPGKCTICGMDLVPVYEGEKALEVREGVVSLSSNQITVIQVQTVEARRQPLRRTLRAAGTLEDNDQRHRFVSAYVEGRVDRLFVNQLGADVTEGQPLVAFYSPMLLTAVREHLALLKAAPTSRPTSDQSLSSPSSAASAGSLLRIASAQRLRQLGLNESQIARLPETFGETNLAVELGAPMTGTVVAKNVYEGQYVKEGDKLFELADFSTMWFVFDAYERDLAWLRRGQTVEVTTASLPGRVFTNAISYIDPTLRDDTRSARVRVEMPNPRVEEEGHPHRLLRHRLYAEGRINVETPEVLTVPRTAVLSPGSRPVVYVELGNGAYEQRPVSLGRAGDDAWEVLEGLNAGERVVSRGNLLIDSQAQLNRVAGSPRSHHAPAVTAKPTAGRPGDDGALLSAEQRKALRELLTASDRIREALSADQLVRFNELAPHLHAALDPMAQVLPDTAPWKKHLAELRRASHLDPAPDLATARKEFHDLSVATVALAKHLRASDTNFAAIKIYQCPMTKRAFPGAPPKAEWLQFTAPIRNPYFGTEMIDCGTEVKP